MAQTSQRKPRRTLREEEKRPHSVTHATPPQQKQQTLRLSHRGAIAIFSIVLVLGIIIGALGHKFTTQAIAPQSKQPEKIVDHKQKKVETQNKKSGKENKKKQESDTANSDSSKQSEPQPSANTKDGIAVISPTLSVDYADPYAITGLVNKHWNTPAHYEPTNLVDVSSLGIPTRGTNTAMRIEAAEAMAGMYQAAAASGSPFSLVSGYRSIATQEYLFNSYVATSGVEEAETYSARPTYSEHHTGLAADLGEPSGMDDFAESYENTPSGKWLAAHSWEYGFILRYPRDKQGTTGYIYEPWHFRYVGKDVAEAYKNSGKATYEDFLGVDPAPSYGADKRAS